MTAPSLIARQLRTAGRAFRSWLKVWASSPLLHACRLSTGAATAGIASMVVIGTTGAMLGVSPSRAQEKHRADFVTGSVDDSVLTQALDALRRNGSVTPRSLTVRNGETLSSLLARLEVVDPPAVSSIRSHLYLEGPHPQDSRRIEVTRTGELFAAAEYPVAFDTLEESISGVASSGFAATVESLRIPADIAEQLKVVWEGADNPVRTLKQGDSLRLVFERKFAGGDFIRNGQLLAVQVVSGEDVHEAYWFENDSRAGGFYTLAGRASQQTFMRVPLDVKDVSSEFAPLRRHPVTGVVRPHNGTDFRAPSGSRIFAAADGVVTFVGYERKGYGRYVKIDHGLGRTTLYAHMSRITKNLRAGQKVERGDVIGYVGRTGLATGPHLHYELMFDGVQINPRTADLPDTANLTAFQVAQLKTIARPIQARFDLLAESESLPVPTVLRTHRDDATAVAKHLLGDEEQAEGASRVAHRVTSMKED